MKKLSVILSVLLLIALISSCSVNASKMDDKVAKDCIKKVTYIYDSRTGVCFALIASRKTGSTNQTGLGITTVPYEKVEHILSPENIIK